MTRLAILISTACLLSGCALATPQIIDNGVQSRVFIPCATDGLCFRSGYSVARNSGGLNNCSEFPVSYRTKQSEYESGRTEYIQYRGAAATEQALSGGAQ